MDMVTFKGFYISFGPLFFLVADPWILETGAQRAHTNLRLNSNHGQKNPRQDPITSNVITGEILQFSRCSSLLVSGL